MSLLRDGDDLQGRMRKHVTVHSIVDETVKAFITSDGWKFVQNWQAFPEAKYVVYDLLADPREELPMKVVDVLSGSLSAYGVDEETLVLAKRKALGGLRMKCNLADVLNFEEFIYPHPREAIARMLLAKDDLIMSAYQLSGCGTSMANGKYEAHCSSGDCKTISDNPTVPIYRKHPDGEKSRELKLERIVRYGSRSWHINYYPESMRPVERWYRNTD